MKSDRRIFLLLLASGEGQRFGARKAFYEIFNKPLWQHALAPFYSCSLKEVLMLIPPDHPRSTLQIPKTPWPFRLAIGGETRAQSVLKGLDVLLDHGINDEDWVLVHDVARAALHEEDVWRLMINLEDRIVGAILAEPLRDALKTCNEGFVVGHLGKKGYCLAQTPQCFRFNDLYTALSFADKQGIEVGDEAQAIALVARDPIIVWSVYPNPKLTYPQDVGYMRYLLQNRKLEEGSHVH